MRQFEQFILDNYGKESTFASFLPGIAGTHGIPIWCYYVNRGQCVVSFGVDNKDHAIMEYYPAHQAYENVKRTGFRTFIRNNGRYFESFSNESLPHSMTIQMNELTISEVNDQEGITTTVVYDTLPGEKLGALMRILTITNCSDTQADLEIMDGMPSLIPYGVGMESMKTMGQTTKAWMQVEDVESKVPYYRVRVSMDDSAAVKEIMGGNFSFALLEDGSLLDPIVDPDVLFGYDCSLANAIIFMEEGLAGVASRKQNIKNLLPCSFYGIKKKLSPNESITIYEMIGQVENRKLLDAFLHDQKDGDYFKEKQKEAEALADEIGNVITTVTGNKVFDAYCRYTYFDNALRGGFPVKLGSNKIFYLYSRKHGDLERDYNYFTILPEFYSQGNGNFRDVVQNRRCDTFFTPFVERANIKAFYSLIQLDGYNPLVVEKFTYQLQEVKAEAIFMNLPDKIKSQLIDFVTVPFTPGQLYSKLNEIMEDGEEKERLFFHTIDFADSMVNGVFGEGYWSDHWTYHLDLIESYIEVFPEREREILMEEDYTYFLSQVNVNRRSKRYEKTENGIRQYHALNKESRRNTTEKLVRGDFGKGEIHKVTLLEKIILLCTLKYASLDSYGMGVEMEGGKPGWNDSLNGLPGMLGSSMAESYELQRTLEYAIKVLGAYPCEVSLTKELGEFMEQLAEVDKEEKSHILSDQEVMGFWNGINDAKEAYREMTYQGISGSKTVYDSSILLGFLKAFQETVRCGIKKTCSYGDGICPTYFTYDVTEYEEREEGIVPLSMKVRTIPHYLEGPVRYLKLNNTLSEKKELYKRIKNSDIYDNKLSMYKLNESLEKASFEIGRGRAFTPGWLENESVWLHMEYKYLLELLKSGLYEEFFEDFHTAAIPFMDPKVYGRSNLENSSFIASSKNPDEKIHGKGFVARLSGSTVEFINIWKIMMFGKTVFFLKDGELAFGVKPAIPEYLIGDNKMIKATLLGDIEVIYHFDQRRDYYPGNYNVASMNLLYKNGSKAEIFSDFIAGKFAEDIRNKKVKTISVLIK